MRIGVVVSEWNSEITEAMFIAAKDILVQASCPEKNIFRLDVPGSFELTLGAQWLLESKKPDAVICIGCVVQGETRHFDFICQAVSQGIMQLGMKYNTPVIFGVLTPQNMQQAKDRAGGKLGNKGAEAAVTALHMAYHRKQLLIKK